MAIDRTPRRATAATLVDVPDTLLDNAGDAPLLSGADIPFAGDDGVRYILHTADVLGAGGQGTVVRASDASGRDFAAKISWVPHGAKDRMNRRTVAGFLRSLVREHPLRERHYLKTHLMPLLAAGQVRDRLPGMDETVYDVAVMPVCGESFAQRADVTYEEIRTAILPQVAEALHLLHERRIVHRDINPKNLYLLDGCVVVGDFGISGVLDEGCDTGSTKIDRRTPGYSPHSSVVQRENDWYSLGYTVWTLYNGGRHPHQALIDADDLSAVLAGKRPVPFSAKQPAHESLGELIFGLTYAFSAGRLGYEAVMRWCESPLEFHYADPMLKGAGASDATGSRARRGYQFEGAEYADAAQLAAALCARWERAKRHLYTHALEEYFRSQGQTDLAVALNDIVETDEETVIDHDLGLARALSLIDPDGAAFRWKGCAFELAGFAEFARRAGDADALSFLRSGLLSQHAKASGAQAQAAMRCVEDAAREQPAFALAFARLKFSGEAPALHGATNADACFALMAATPAGFYERIGNDREMHGLAGFLAALGHFEQAALFDAALGGSDAAARAGMLLALFDSVCDDSDAPRRFNARFGPFAHVRWIAENAGGYEARSAEAASLLASLATPPCTDGLPVDQAIKALASVEDRLAALRARMPESPYIAYLGVDSASDVIPRNMDMFFTAEFMGRSVPRGYMREMADASQAEPQAAAHLREKHVLGVTPKIKRHAAETAKEAAGALREAATRQKDARTPGGRTPASAAIMLGLSAAFVLFAGMLWPYLTLMLHLINDEWAAWGGMQLPMMRTSTLSVAAFAGLLVAACASMSYRIADLVSAVRARNDAGAAKERVASMEKTVTAIDMGADEVSISLSTGLRDMPRPLPTDGLVHEVGANSHGGGVRRGLCSTLFWAGSGVCAAALLLLSLKGLPFQTAFNFGLAIDPAIAQGIYLIAAIALFALAAKYLGPKKSMPGTVALCLAPVAVMVACYVIAAALALAVVAAIVAIAGRIFGSR